MGDHFVYIHFCLILFTGTRIRIDSVMCPRSSSTGRNTSASVTVTVLRSQYLTYIGRHNEYWQWSPLLLGKKRQCVKVGPVVVHDSNCRTAVCGTCEHVIE